MNTTAVQKDAVERFVERVEKLDNGELAQLRRAAGDRLNDRRELLWFAGIARSVETETVDFLVATLLAQYSSLDIRAGRHRGKKDFGSTWRNAIGPKPSESLRRRFHVLLNSDLEPDGSGDLPYRMRQMVRYAASKGAGVDWPRLLRDLDAWRHPDRPVQKRWARTFFVSSTDESTLEENV